MKFIKLITIKFCSEDATILRRDVNLIKLIDIII